VKHLAEDMGYSTGKPASLLSAGCSFGARSVPVGIGGQNEYVMTRLYAGSEQSSGSMRILQVVGTLAPCYGGPSIACPELSRELVRQGTPSFHLRQRRAQEYLEVPLDRPVIEQGVEIRYFSALARPDK